LISVVLLFPREVLLIVVVAVHRGEGYGQCVVVAGGEGVGPTRGLVVLGHDRVLLVAGVGRLDEDRRLKRAVWALQAERRYPALVPRRCAARDLGIVVAVWGEVRGSC